LICDDAPISMPDVDSREVPGSTTRTAGRLGLLFVVDDEPIVRMALSRALEAAGYRVESFDRVESVLDALEVRAPRVQAVIADVVMPGKSGLDLLAEARTRWPELPILNITGQGTVAAAVEAMRLGAYARAGAAAPARTQSIPGKPAPSHGPGGRPGRGVGGHAARLLVDLRRGADGHDGHHTRGERHGQGARRARHS
jgi:CheY-like chemotaxis protein